MVVPQRGLIAIGQRGFRVARVGRVDLEDISRVHIVVESEALRMSIAQGDRTWEVGIVAAFQHLGLHLDRAISPRFAHLVYQSYRLVYWHVTADGYAAQGARRPGRTSICVAWRTDTKDQG